MVLTYRKRKRFVRTKRQKRLNFNGLFASPWTTAIFFTLSTWFGVTQVMMGEMSKPQRYRHLSTTSYMFSSDKKHNPRENAPLLSPAAMRMIEEDLTEDLPPVYWINLDRSSDRRDQMTDMFARVSHSTKRPVRNVRVSAVDVLQTKEWIENGQVDFCQSTILFEGKRNASLNIYEGKEAACTLSHIKAIQQAYNDGHQKAIIMEDDAALRPEFVRHWNVHLLQAPSDWKVLQLANCNPLLSNQTANLMDPWVSWTPYFWSTEAYLINREGMEKVLSNVMGDTEQVQPSTSLAPSVSTAATTTSTAYMRGTPRNTEATTADIAEPPVSVRIQEPGIVVADELIYYLAKEAYTTTFPFVDSMETKSTVHDDMPFRDKPLASFRRDVQPKWMHFLPDSIFVYMTLTVSSTDAFREQLRRIQQDSEVLCRVHYEKCDWAVHVVPTFNDLGELDDEFQNFSPPFKSNIQVYIESPILETSEDNRQNSRPFNQFQFLPLHLDTVRRYDYFLLKDSTSRIAGFPWLSFMQRKGNAMIAGPLREDVDDVLLRDRLTPKHEWMQFQNVFNWRRAPWSEQLFKDVTPVQVDSMEMFFVLLEGSFASWFFERFLKFQDAGETSVNDWEVETMWCEAARDYHAQLRRDYRLPGCYLVPVVVKNEHDRDGSAKKRIDRAETLRQESSMTIPEKSSWHHSSSLIMTDKDPRTILQEWKAASLPWEQLIGGSDLWEVRSKCLKSRKACQGLKQYLKKKKPSEK